MNSLSSLKVPNFPNNRKAIAAGGAATAAAAAAGGVFLSLSIGTHKSPNLTLHSPSTQLQTLTKVYPNKVVFYRFKHIFRQAEPQACQVSTSNERTQQQIEDSELASLRRTRRQIADIVDCNDFDMFATFTFDPKKHPDCADYQYAKKKMVQWLNKQQARHGSFRYILVPERQSNANIHFHALLGGFTGKYYATNIRGTGKNARQCYKITSWEKSNGFADMEQISNKEATGKYIGKYITKEITSNTGNAEHDSGKHLKIQAKGEKRYFASKNLKKPQKRYNDDKTSILLDTSLDIANAKVYENDFVEITTIHKRDTMK